MGSHRVFEGVGKESKVAQLEKFLGKRGNEVYCWFAQLWLVFRGKSRLYHSNADKVAFALLYMAGATRNWTMPLLQTFDEGWEHELLLNYDAFQEAVIGIYGNLDRQSNAKDRLTKL